MQAGPPMNKTGKEVALFWDIGSTNTYFALKLIQPLIERAKAELKLIPFNLGYVFRSNNYVLMDEPRAKLSNRRRDLQRWAERYDLPFRMPDKFPIKTSRALRGALFMREKGLEMPFVEAMFTAYWENNDPSVETHEGLTAIATSLGVDAAEFMQGVESERIRDQLIESTNQGLAQGVFGVPSILIDDELYWGKDRMEFVEAALGL